MSWPTPSPTAGNELASHWMHRGLDLLNTNIPAHVQEAVQCFDRAIALRRTLPLDENPYDRYLLAGGWINRAGALGRLGGKEHVTQALASYDEALELLRSLPLAEDPLYPRRCAIAWINRGLAVQQQETAASGAQALRCFREALEILKHPAAQALDDLHLLRAGALINLGGALLESSPSATTEARNSAQQALALLKKTERHDANAAEAGLKARHVFCRALAAEFGHGASVPPDLMALATEAVDDGLALARHWEERGQRQFQPLAEDLFRFGCRIYSTRQPHFLAEFILESLDPQKTPGVLPLNGIAHDTALAALWNALRGIQRDGFPSPSTPRFAQLLENLRDLRLTEQRLQQLRQAAPA